MIMQVGCEVEQSLNITITYDDGTSKTSVISEGDYVSMAYNKNGVKHLATGTVATIHANPYNGKLSRNDWYIVISNDLTEDGINAAVRININSIVDINVLRMKHYTHSVNTPNNDMRVTDIRVKANYLQISTNNGKTWLTVGASELSDAPIGDEKSIADKVNDLIGSDQQIGSTEFIQGIIKIIDQEVRRRQICIQKSEDTDDGSGCDCHH